MAGRRLLLLLAVLTLVGVPAAALRAACAGRSCSTGEDEPARVPFCPLPADVRLAIENGYREGRSPEVLVVTAAGARMAHPSEAAGLPVAWPAVDEGSTDVPLVFAGTGVRPGADVPPGTTLDRVAPTVAEIIRLSRPHPDVRSGTPIPGVAGVDRPSLVVLVVWKGVGGRTLEVDPEDWPFLRASIEAGAGTLGATPGSLPLDPAAVQTTIGTGGLPAQHGITGGYVRTDDGRVVTAFGPDAPLPVIATLAEDLDELNGNSADVTLVAPAALDRGLIGGAWYPGHDRDAVVTATGRDAVAAAERSLSRLSRSPVGRDAVPDLLAVALEGDVGSIDRWTRAVAAAADRTTGGRALLVIAGTGDPADRDAIDASTLADAVERDAAGVVERLVPGGLFLDQDVLTREGITGQTVVGSLLEATDGGGRRVVRDAFQGFAVSFARYC